MTGDEVGGMLACCVVTIVSAIAGLIVVVYGVRQKDWTLVVGGILFSVFLELVLLLFLGLVASLLE